MRRAGHVTVEALVALLLLLFVLRLGWGLVASAGRAAATLADRAESLAALRTAAWVIQEEVDGARAGEDVLVPAGDSFPLRAFRGLGRVCGPPRGGSLPVLYQGEREPDPAKDSVLVLASDGRWIAAALLAVEPGGGACAEGARDRPRWRLAADPVPGSLLRVFERGSYHLAGGALRYRIGGGGRQPLTPDALDAHGSSLTAAGPTSVRLRASARGPHTGLAGPAWERVYRLEHGR